MLKIAVWSVFVLGVGVGGTLAYYRINTPPQYESYTVFKDRISRGAKSAGKIEGLSEVKIRAPRTTVVNRIFAEEGKEFKHGKTLFELSSVELDAKIAEAEAALKERAAALELAQSSPPAVKVEQAKQELNKAQESVNAEKARLEALKEPQKIHKATQLEVDEANLAILLAEKEKAIAEVELSKVTSGRTVAELNLADEEVKAPQKELDIAEEQLRNFKEPGTTLPILGTPPLGPTKAQLQEKVARAKSNVELAKAKYEIFIKGANPYDIQLARSKFEACDIEIKAAKMALDRLQNPEPPPEVSKFKILEVQASILQAEAGALKAEALLQELQLPPEKARIDQAAAAKEGAQKALDALKLQKEGLTPSLTFDAWITQRHEEPGAIVNALSPILTVIDFSEKKVRAEFDVNRLTDIKEKMPVKIKVFNEELDGIVEKIGRVGPRTLFSDDKSEPTGGQVFQAMIAFAERKTPQQQTAYDALRPDLRVDTTVILEQREDVVVAKKTFISHETDDVAKLEPYVLLLEQSADGKGQSVRKQRVKCGLYDEHFVEIKEGLKVGDRIAKPLAAGR